VNDARKGNGEYSNGNGNTIDNDNGYNTGGGNGNLRTTGLSTKGTGKLTTGSSDTKAVEAAYDKNPEDTNLRQKYRDTLVAKKNALTKNLRSAKTNDAKKTIQQKLTQTKAKLNAIPMTPFTYVYPSIYFSVHLPPLAKKRLENYQKKKDPVHLKALKSALKSKEAHYIKAISSSASNPILKEINRRRLAIVRNTLMKLPHGGSGSKADTSSKVKVNPNLGNGKKSKKM
jgi:hypothetical protein